MSTWLKRGRGLFCGATKANTGNPDIATVSCGKTLAAAPTRPVFFFKSRRRHAPKYTVISWSPRVGARKLKREDLACLSAVSKMSYEMSVMYPRISSTALRQTGGFRHFAYAGVCREPPSLMGRSGGAGNSHSF